MKDLVFSFLNAWRVDEIVVFDGVITPGETCGDLASFLAYPSVDNGLAVVTLMCRS